MDPTEDLSARVLLKHILTTEPPRTPVTSSDSQEPSSSGARSSSRLSKKDAGAQTPQEILRRSMRQKLHESITRKYLLATKRRTTSLVLKKINMPATSSSVLINDGDTPRHVLMNVLRTEPVKSPVVHAKGTSEEPEPPSANSTISRARPSMELSGLDLPDVTIGHAASTAKGLSRKRPRRSLNVTAFEKRLKAGDDTGEETEESVDDNSSLSVLSSTSLTLKTPFVDAKTEKRGLQRRVSNRRKISDEEFGAAVDKRQMRGVSSFAPAQQDFSESAESEGITLGLSKLSEPDITADIVNCNTALYAQPEAMTSNFSTVATQDKPTVMASQLQREMELKKQSKLETDQLMDVFPSEDESEKKEGRRTVYGQPEDVAMVAKSAGEEDVVESQTSVSDAAQFEEGENRVEAQSEEEHVPDSQPEDGIEAGSQAEEEEAAADSKTEEEEVEVVVDSHSDGGAADSQSEKGDEAGSQSEEDENLAQSQTEEEEEEGAGESHTGFQSEEDDETSSQSEEEEVAPDFQTEEEEEEGTAGYQTDEAAAALPEEDVEVSPQSETNEDVAMSQDEDDCELINSEKGEEASEQLQHDLEHVSRRAHLSEGGLIMPVNEAAEDFTNATVAGCFDAKSEAQGTLDLHSSFEIGSLESGQAHARDPDLVESSTEGQAGASGTENKPDADKENSFPPPEGTYDIEEGGSEAFSEEAPDQDAVEPEEESEDEGDDEENEEFPCKTPFFVREKMNLNRPDPLSSPSVLKNVQASTSGTKESLPAAKPKQRRVRKTSMSKKETALPKSYLMGVFKHFAKTKVSADVYPVLNEIMDKFFDRLAEDLETYALHAKRKTIEIEDVELLLKRQGYVNDKVPVEVLIEKYLRMDQRRVLIPVATSGNVVIPAKRR
ncbi:centromere protein T [Archocentrus centrarchus]|uniref:centromere protein T n=1 Tax=Archocentrus centrarchus TaxID=63155 RepID=UPI0011EA4AFF|nr:centromere protein T [Archocentrus centrarchus]